MAIGNLQQTIYAGLINGNHLAPGTTQDGSDDVHAAAGRAAGAGALLNGYISLGLPQALASDDILNGLVNGAGSDPFTTPDPNGCNVRGVVAGGTLEAEVINYLQDASTKVVKGSPAVRDPMQCISLLVQDRVAALAPAIAAHIIPASGSAQTASRVQSLAASAGPAQPAGTASTMFAEDNPLIAPTLDRIVDTQAALSEEMANGTRLTVEVDGTGQGIVTGGGINCPGTCSAQETPQSSATLSATPAPGSSFIGWSGACTGTGTCTVALPYDQNVIATFGPGGSTAATGGTPSAAGSPTAAGTATAAKCTLKAVSNKVLLAARKGRAKKGAPVIKPGTVTLTVKCTQAGKVKLTGTLTQLIGAKPKHGRQKSKTYRLGPASGSVTAGRALRLTLRLPAAAVSALGKGAKESAAFTVVLGSGRATARIAAVRGTR